MALGTKPRQRLTVAAACTAQVMMVLDVMSVALPSLHHELRLSPAGLEWVVSAYALALAALIPTGGALGDHFGCRRIFMSVVALFALASVGCKHTRSGAALAAERVTLRDRRWSTAGAQDPPIWTAGRRPGVLICAAR
jgi:MFS family permease